MSFDDNALGVSAELNRLADVMQVSVPVGAAAPAAARRALAGWLGACDSDRVLIDAPLVVSELVTNSVRHAGLSDGAMVRISAELAAGVLRLEVEDSGTAGAVVQRSADDCDGGFGLNIVDALAARWGVQRDGATLLWAEFRC
jgi:anti-sigma regulatory factor (Ser/Thr protein kinase)